MSDTPLTDDALAEVLVNGPRPTWVTLGAYDPAWPARFEARAADLRAVLASGPGSSSTSGPPRCPGSPPSRRSASSSASTTPTTSPPTSPTSRRRATTCGFASHNTAACASATGRTGQSALLRARPSRDAQVSPLPRPPARRGERPAPVRGGQACPCRPRVARHELLRGSQASGHRGHPQTRRMERMIDLATPNGARLMTFW